MSEGDRPPSGSTASGIRSSSASLAWSRPLGRYCSSSSPRSRFRGRVEVSPRSNRPERRGLPRSAQRSHRAGAGLDLQVPGRHLGHRFGVPIPGHLNARLRAQRDAALCLPAPTHGRLAGAARERPDPLPRRLLDRSAVALPDRLLGLDRGRAGRPAGPRPRRSRGRQDRLRATRGLNLLLGARGAVRRRGAGQRLGGRRPRIGRLYVAFVPLALYAIWWLGWGHTAESTFSLDNVLESPKYVFDAASQAMASLLGLATPLTGSGANRLASIGVGSCW